MEKFSSENFNFGHAFYSKYIQEDENTQARAKAILNQIHENRVAVKVLHTEFGTKFCQIINSYRDRLGENEDYYDTLLQDLISRREKILEDCKKACSESQGTLQ